MWEFAFFNRKRHLRIKRRKCGQVEDETSCGLRLRGCLGPLGSPRMCSTCTELALAPSLPRRPPGGAGPGEPLLSRPESRSHSVFRSFAHPAVPAATLVPSSPRRMGVPGRSEARQRTHEDAPGPAPRALRPAHAQECSSSVQPHASPPPSRQASPCTPPARPLPATLGHTPFTAR